MVEESGFDSRQGRFFYSHNVHTDSEVNSTRYGYRGTVSPELKRQGREADLSPPSRAEVKNG
jgi:hypothetical protein